MHKIGMAYSDGIDEEKTVTLKSEVMKIVDPVKVALMVRNRENIAPICLVCRNLESGQAVGGNKNEVAEQWYYKSGPETPLNVICPFFVLMRK